MILIAGGGIGGLALAIALARQNFDVTILERNAVFSEAGAGIQLGPNAIRILRDIGVADTLEPLAGKPTSIRVFDGPSGDRLADLPLGSWIADRHGAPYWVTHRADLQAALLQVARATRGITIRTGFEVAAVRDEGGSVTAVGESGETLSGHALIGADGLWSKVRKVVFPGLDIPYSGRTAARTLIAADAAGAPFDETITGAWLAPKSHVVHYPVRGGREIAVIVVVEEEFPGVGWGMETDRAALLDHLSAFSPRLLAFLAKGGEWRKWALYTPMPFQSWTSGRVALLGDAAHPVLPFLAQGGVLALEDAMVLAREIAAQPGDIGAALTRYETLRKPRAANVQAASRRNGQIYHLAGGLARARNATLRSLPGSLVMMGYDWLYGWRADAV